MQIYTMDDRKFHCSVYKLNLKQTVMADTFLSEHSYVCVWTQLYMCLDTASGYLDRKTTFYNKSSECRVC